MHIKSPPQPPNIAWGLNNIAAFYRSPLNFLLQLGNKYNGVCAIKIGKQAINLVSHPDLVSQVLVDQQDKFPKWRLHDEILAQYLDYDAGVSAFDSAFYKTQRRVVQPAFHARAIDSYVEGVVDETYQVSCQWPVDVEHDIVKQFAELSLQVIARVLFRINVFDRIGSINREVADVQTQVGRQILNFFVLPSWLPKSTSRPNLATINSLTSEALASHSGNPAGSSDLLSVILGTMAQNGEDLDQRLAENMLLMLLVSAYDTTATALCWLFFLLSQFPAVEQKLLAEIHGVVGNRPITSANLSHLTYTEMVIKEVLRLYPPVWLILREANEDVEVGGYDLKKGSLVIVSPYVTQRSPKLFAEPDTFNPDRFEEAAIDSILRYSYFPFGLGPHYCIGQPLAMMSLKVMLATLLPRFQWISRGTRSMDMGDKLFHSDRYFQHMMLNSRS